MLSYYLSMEYLLITKGKIITMNGQLNLEIQVHNQVINEDPSTPDMIP